MRRPILAANWKMHKTSVEARAFAEDLAPRVAAVDDVDVVIAPPFTALESLGRALAGTPVALAAQNVHAEPKGAFTGEIAASMLAEIGCRWVIVGHSERRALFGEDDACVAAKRAAAFRVGLGAIVCVGETLEQREAGSAFDTVGSQLDGSLDGTDPGTLDHLVIAYEPVWAIGTGRTATSEIAQEIHGFIREKLRDRFGAAGDGVRIQYGGSVKPENVAELMAQPDIDGALIGGASLDPESFYAIIRFRSTPEEPLT